MTYHATFAASNRDPLGKCTKKKTFQGGASFADPFLLFMFHVHLCYAILSVLCSLVITCWERADLLFLLCVVFSCVYVTFPYGVLGQLYRLPLYSVELNYFLSKLPTLTDLLPLHYFFDSKMITNRRVLHFGIYDRCFSVFNECILFKT